MIEIILTSAAKNDLTRLHKFLALENISAAQKAIQTLISSIDRLKVFPEMGISTPELKEMRVLHRQFGKSGYRIYYRWLKNLNQILILKIQHQKENYN